MYRVDYYDTATGRLSMLIFNSIDAAHKFIKELLNREDVKDFIKHLRNRKLVYSLNYAPPEKQLSETYGDVDSEFPTILTLKLLVHRNGTYEYRLGCSSSTPPRTMYFKVTLLGVDNISKGVCTDETDKLHNASVKLNQVFSNEYSRSYHE